MDISTPKIIIKIGTTMLYVANKVNLKIPKNNKAKPTGNVVTALKRLISYFFIVSKFLPILFNLIYPSNVPLRAGELGF